MVGILRDRGGHDRLGGVVCRSCFTAEDFFKVLAEAGGEKFFTRSEARVPVDRGRVPEGEEVEMILPRSEADPRMSRRTGIVDHFPLDEGEDGPEFAPAGFEAVGLEQVAADLGGQTHLVRGFPGAEAVFSNGWKKRRVDLLRPGFGQFREGYDLGFPGGAHVPRS